MKIIRRIIPALVFMLFTACANMTLQQQATIQRLADAAGAAAQVAAQYDTAHRAQFEQGKAALDAFLGDAGASASGLATIVAQLPPIFDAKTALYVQGGLILYDVVGGLLFNVQTDTSVRVFAKAIRDGIARGLSAPAVANKSIGIGPNNSPYASHGAPLPKHFKARKI